MTSKSKTSSRTARSLLLPSSRTAHPSFDVIPDGAPFFRRHPGRRAAPSRDPGEYPASAGDAHEDNARSKPLRPSRWIPGSACGGPGMTSKAKHPSRRYAPLVTSSRTARPFFTDVIPDGAQRRAGIQTNAAQDPLDPHLRGDDKQKAKSSRTAGRADPESRWAHRKSYCMLACDLAVGTRRRAGLSSWDGTPLLVTSSRTARSAEPGSSALQRGLAAMRAVCTRDLPRPGLGSRFGLPRAFPLRRLSGPSSCIARPAHQPPRRIAGRVACRPRPLKPPNDTAATGAWCRASL